MRRAFLSRVADMIRNEPDTTFFTVDIGMWAIRDVLQDFPERCTNVGIYEDAMFSIAAGMSRRGLVPTIFGIQPYLIERALEQIKMDLAYQKLGVNVVGTGAAVDYPKYGYSHYCAEDAQLIKMIPDVSLLPRAQQSSLSSCLTSHIGTDTRPFSGSVTIPIRTTTQTLFLEKQM